MSKPADRDPVAMLLFFAGYSIFMAIVFWVFGHGSGAPHANLPYAAFAGTRPFARSYSTRSA